MEGKLRVERKLKDCLRLTNVFYVANSKYRDLTVCIVRRQVKKVMDLICKMPRYMERREKAMHYMLLGVQMLNEQ